MFAAACENQKVTPALFLSCSPLYLLRQDLSIYIFYFMCVCFAGIHVYAWYVQRLVVGVGLQELEFLVFVSRP